MLRINNLKKIILFCVLIAVISMIFTLITKSNLSKGDIKVFAASENNIVKLQIGNPIMTVNNVEKKIDNAGTSPIIISERTFVPIRAIIEELGGEVEWDNNNQEITLNYKNNVIKLYINSTKAYLNNEENTLDTAPIIINGRTMFPIRFISESFGFNVDWNETTQTITISSVKINEGKYDMKTENTSQYISETNEENVVKNTPVVYMTNNISPEALMSIYNKLEFKPTGNTAIKLSTGEAGNTHYLDPNLIKNLIQSVDGTIVECNTAYGGSRSETEMHRQVAKEHGFTAIADVDIMDADGSIQIPVSDKAENLKYDIVGKNYENYNSMIVLSHFKGHAMGGFGGAVKNISIGIGSSKGKMYIHSGGHSETSWSGGTQDEFLESMAEAAQAVHNDKQKNGGIIYISVMNHLSVDCDCDGNPAKPEMNDVGILASYDPVALDQACVDIVYNTDRSESGALIERIESRNGIHTLEHAEKIGLGSRKYNLVNIDN